MHDSQAQAAIVHSALPRGGPCHLPAPQPAKLPFRDALLKIVPDLRAFARSLAGNVDAADDLVQETLTRAWASQAGFDPASNIRAWTFTILRNAHYSRWHKTKREVHWDPDLDHRTSTRAGQEASIDFADLYRALQSLPIAQREALILVGAAGWSYEEAAIICGCQPGTIKSRVSRARTALLVREAECASSDQPRGSGDYAFDAILVAVDSSICRWKAMQNA